MDRIKEILVYFCVGVRDSLIGLISIKNFFDYPKKRRHRLVRSASTSREPTATRTELIRKLLLCFGLNGVAFGLSTCLFYYLLLPGVCHIAKLVGEETMAYELWLWLQPILSYTFGMFWVLPLFILSRVMNSFWFQDIADLAFEMACGPPQFVPSFSYHMSETFCSGAVEFLFLLQSCIVALFPIPYVGTFLSLFHLSLLYSLYSFEYKWYKMGWPLNKRLLFVDYTWPYFLGFGLPLAAATMLTESQIASICLFSVLFPLYVIGGTTSTPSGGDFKFRLHIFDPVTYCLNFLSGKLFQRR